MTDFPDHAFGFDDLSALGISRHHLRTAIADGVVRRVLRGVYAARDVPDDAASRARAAAIVLAPHVVVSDRSAAWIHGVDAFDPTALDFPPDLEVVSVDGEPTRRDGVLGGKRALLPEDVMKLHGIRVTTPVRTACDLACQRGRYAALAVLDAFMRIHGLTHRDLEHAAQRYAGRRGVRQLRELLRLASPLAESPGESWTRMAIADAGLPMPQLQVWVDVPAHGRARLDLAYPSLRIAIEYDGEEFHTSEPDREADRLRRKALRAAGWIVIVVTKGDFKGAALDGWLLQLRQAIADRRPASRRSYPRPPVESRPVRHAGRSARHR